MLSAVLCILLHRKRWEAAMSQTFRVQAQENRSIAGTEFRYRTVNVDQSKIFYRKAGVRGAPAILLCEPSRPRATSSGVRFRYLPIGFLVETNKKMSIFRSQHSSRRSSKPCRSVCKTWRTARPRNSNRPSKSHCDSSNGHPLLYWQGAYQQIAQKQSPPQE